MTMSTDDFQLPIEYLDGQNYVYAAKTFYKIPPNNPWTLYFNFPPYYFACHLPGYPLVIKFFSIIFFNCYYVGNVLAIVFCSILSIYVFRRLLIVYKCVKNITFTCTLFLIIPLRMFLYRKD